MRALLLSALLVVSMAVAGVAGAQETGDDERPNACVGTVEEQPDQETIVSIQGSRVTADGAEKTNALLVSFAPNGSFRWAQNSTANNRWWAYDVDPMDDGNLLYGTTGNRHSILGEFDPDAGEYEWVKRFNGEPDDEQTPFVKDAHDWDMVGEHEVATVDKGQGHERLLVYNLTADRVAWEWRFEDHPEHFPESGGGPADDWTHINDVELIGEDLYMVSVRNFDQVVFINRTTEEVEMTLGEDDNYDILNEQHNPDHLWGPDGENTVIVADSLNDRVVEYEYQADAGEWERVWSVGGMDEPRDADRLPNGNTLIADRRGHRVLEVTPEGETVWEVYTPYEPYDVERGEVDESNGPTMAEQNVSGDYDVSNDAGFSTDEIETCADAMFSYASPNSDGPGLDSYTVDGNASVGSDADGSGGSPSIPTAALVAGAFVVVALLGAGLYRYR